MFEKFLSENIENFRQRYEGTFGFYKDGKKRLLVKLVEVSANNCAFQDARGVSYSVNPDHPGDVGFEFLPPKSMWYNTSRGAMYAQRLAHRQYQRGVTSKTLEVHVLRSGELVPAAVNFAVLSDIYEKAIPAATAWKNLSELPSLAISGQFVLDTASKVVRVLKEPIGQYTQPNARTLAFKLVEPDLWKTEISDACKIMGCSAEFTS